MYSGIADAKERSEKVVAHLCEQFGFLTEELIAIILFSGPSSTAGEEDVVTQGCVNACTVESCAADGHKTSEHSDQARIVSKASAMSAARPATEERAEHKQPRPGANMSLHRTCAPLPQRDVVYSSS